MLNIDKMRICIPERREHLERWLRGLDALDRETAFDLLASGADAPKPTDAEMAIEPHVIFSYFVAQAAALCVAEIFVKLHDEEQAAKPK